MKLAAFGKGIIARYTDRCEIGCSRPADREAHHETMMATEPGRRPFPFWPRRRRLRPCSRRPRLRLTSCSPWPMLRSAPVFRTATFELWPITAASGRSGSGNTGLRPNRPSAHTSPRSPSPAPKAGKGGPHHRFRLMARRQETGSPLLRRQSATRTSEGSRLASRSRLHC